MLVIIGLIVGGVLVGQNLIAAAEVRAQITQIEKYNSAVNTFRGKFNAIPGDMNIAAAQQYGFITGAGCTGVAGQRNGDGIIDGTSAGSVTQMRGETALFWQDISSSAAGNLIDVVIPGGSAGNLTCNGALTNLSGTGLLNYFPTAKIGHSNSLYVFENSGTNWYGLSNVTLVDMGGNPYSTPNIPVIQAYNIDKKIDDGNPASGNVQAFYITYASGAAIINAPNTSTSGGTSSSCYDTTTGTYSVTVNNGNGGNCALSFKFQ